MRSSIADTLETLNEVREINSSFPYTGPIKAWKEGGKKVVAFQCAYIPEEVIYAAGILPIRLTGDSKVVETDEATAYMYHNTCSFVRTSLQLVLEGKYHFLDGFVVGSTCDFCARLANVWEHYQLTPFVHTLSIPHKTTELAYETYRLQVLGLKRSLEEFFKVEITDQALWDAVEVYNRGRALLRKLYELKKLDASPITGAETLEVINASRRMPPEQFNELMERLLEEVTSRKQAVEGKLRLMISGSPLNNAEFVRAIENLGGVVVVDELCTGIKYWWEDVITDPDAIKAISRRYLHNFACPRMLPSQDRFELVSKLAREYRIDGVVSVIIRHCSKWGSDAPMLRRRLEDEGIPVLELDTEYGTSATGQILTRVQAFFEMLQQRRE